MSKLDEMKRRNVVITNECYVLLLKHKADAVEKGKLTPSFSEIIVEKLK